LETIGSELKKHRTQTGMSVLLFEQIRILSTYWNYFLLLAAAIAKCVYGWYNSASNLKGFTYEGNT
jgi:hypothetical protein